MFRISGWRGFRAPTSPNSSHVCGPVRRLSRYEPLESRLMLYAVSGRSWSDTDVSFSFLPDGTESEGYQSNLYAELDSVADTAIWQRQFARALQTWSNVSGLNFHGVNDDGSPTGTSGQSQGDSRFGDIRLGAHPLDGFVGYAYYPSSTTKGGDITINPNYTFKVGSHIDLYSVLLHETGHALGLKHSSSGTIMYQNITGVYSDLSTDDIDGIQAIYGARQDDLFDLNSRNDSLASASSLNLDSDGNGLFAADLTTIGDLDYYELNAPTSANGNLTVSVDVDGLSLLASQVSLFDAAGALVSSVDVGAAYGTNATLQFSGVVAGETYYLLADGVTTDEFGMGAYWLDVDFDLSEDPDPPAFDPDRFESNETLLTATDLGRLNNRTEMELTLHTASDIDLFHFTARKGGDFRITTNFTAASNYEITVYDANKSLVSQTVGSSIQMALSRSEDAFVQVRSLAAEVDSYDLIFERVGIGSTGGGEGGGKGGNGKGNGKGATIWASNEGHGSHVQPQVDSGRAGLSEIDRSGIGRFTPNPASSRPLSSHTHTSHTRTSHTRTSHTHTSHTHTSQTAQTRFDRYTDGTNHGLRSMDRVELRQVDWLMGTDGGNDKPDGAYGTGVTGGSDSQGADRLADIAPLLGQLDMEAMLEDLAEEWTRSPRVA
jgi:hypothetical protein